MEFWGEELKPGSKVSFNTGQGYVIHLSQAALGEIKKGSENVVVYVEVNDKKLVLGTMSVEKHPQIMCDLIFEKDFEQSHSSKTTSVFLCGYRSPIPIIGSNSGEDEISSNEELETDEILMKNDKTKVSVMDGKNDKQDVDDDFTDDSDSEMSEDESIDEETSSGANVTDDSEDETEDLEEQRSTQKKPEVVSKKRVSETMTPSSKKAKAEPSGQRTGDKKTPAEQDSKTPADQCEIFLLGIKILMIERATRALCSSKSNEKSPIPGSHACKSCSTTFGSQSALEPHTKEKHEA
ncbi:histone deacetylase HDT2-like [Panicum virgatum]|uniref:histone deacetylase HDT2-like n=1 Tax=Panicum virgatum TaxID=38727 RepID=UPI0019D661D8|nr:histone deacetylase HDT2-like [Panicum virgatum]